MTKKIIAIDLDGTLLRRDNTISTYSVEVIQQVKKLGHEVIIATGRPYLMAKAYYEQLGLTGPMITFNGALTHHPTVPDWSGTLSVPIDQKHLLTLLKERDRFALDFVASEYRDHFYMTLEHRERIDPSLFGLTALTEDLRLTPERVTAPPLALLAQTRHPDKYQLAKEIKAYFKEDIEVDSWGGPMNILEFSAKGVHKAFALEKLLSHLGKTREDLIAFGDEHNDTEMLAYAQTGYAMKNANPMLLPFADEQLPYTCDQDGVARKLSEIFMKNNEKKLKATPGAQSVK